MSNKTSSRTASATGNQTKPTMRQHLFLSDFFKLSQTSLNKFCFMSTTSRSDSASGKQTKRQPAQTIRLQWVKSAKQQADILTKALDKTNFIRLRNKLGHHLWIVVDFVTVLLAL